MKCSKIKRDIPKSRLQDGINRCKENVTDFLLDVRLIADAGRFDHAIISLEFALEEFGKALLLKEALKNKSDPVTINGVEFCNHDKKAKKALEIIDPAHIFRVLFGGYFPPEYFGNYFTEGYWGGTTINNDLRLSCAFVDFIENNWTKKRSINPTSFLNLVEIIEQEIKLI